MHYGNSHDGYALVRKGRDGYAMSGDSDDIDDIDALKQHIDGDFIWFRKGGKAYVLRDATVLARAEKAWEGTKPHEAKMRELETRMQPHQRAAEALGARIERMQPKFEETPEMRAAERALEALSRQQEQLSGQHEALIAQMEHADEAKRRQLDRDMQALAARHQSLAAQMQRQSAVLQAQHARMQGDSARMEAIAREMETASKPMEAIGREMEAVGKQLEKQAALADRQVRKLIDEAVQQGLAQPAPTLR
jgi:chromosome segregation ATPase